MKLKLFDILAVIVAVAVVALFTVNAYAEIGGSGEVFIQTPDADYLYAIDQNTDLRLAGPVGSTHVHIRDGRVWVSESDCTQKICIATGDISRSGEWIACLPNRIFVRIQGSDDSPVDAQAF
jgi:hypothetical protein